ncbi:MAG: glycosyltransferase [Actinobacteria bacterium]|nr:glycosyltransferase [Actinomycetota bacterium]
MKILHVATGMNPASGGPVRAVAGLTETLALHNLQVDLFAPKGPDDFAELIKPQGVRLRVFEQGVLARWWPGFSAEMAHSLGQEVSSYDLIHIHEMWSHPHYAAYRAARSASKPYVVSIHGCLQPWAINHKALKKAVYSTVIQRRILGQAAGLHALTQEEAKHIRAYGIDNEIMVIPNGIHPADYEVLPVRKDLDRAYPQLVGRRVALFIGRLHQVKGLDILAEAFGRVARDQKDLSLLVVGPDDGGQKDKVMKTLDSYGVLDQAIFTGMLTGQAKLTVLGGADIFVLPSYSEGFSVAILEALASGLPVIITRQCNFPEILSANAGIVIEPEPSQLAVALEKLFSSESLRKEMGDNGRRLISRQFGWNKIAAQMRTLYDSVLSK